MSNNYLYVLNIHSGILHTKDCADGKVVHPKVEAGSRKHYSNVDSARQDSDYVADHHSVRCMDGINE